MYEATKHFIVLNDFTLMAGDPAEPFEDVGMKITQIPLKFNGKESSPSDPKYGTWVSERIMEQPRSPKQKEEDAVKKPYDQDVSAFIVFIKSRPGKLDIVKCRALGVPQGPMLKLLKEGEDITLDDGTLVRSSDVVGVQEDPLCYLVIECPSQDYFESMKNDKRLMEPESSPEMKFIKGVFHFTPAEVMNTDFYSEWVNSFPVGTQHIVMNQESSGYGMHDMAVHNRKLNLIAPKLFPKLWSSENDVDKASDPYSKIKHGSLIQASTSLKLHVRPNPSVIEKQVLAIDEKAFGEEIDQIEGVREEIKNVNDKMVFKPEASEFPKVIFLGTGSSVPNKYRNVSSILVETEANNFILLDCGEGTILQLHRTFGKARADEILRNLNAIYVSHLHADHHLGLINIVKFREKAFEDQSPTKLYILAPNRIANYLLTVHKLFFNILTDLVLVRNEHLLNQNNPNSNPGEWTQQVYSHIKSELLDQTKLKSVKTVRALHCPGSFCVAVVTKSGYKIVYSGDTMPIPQIVDLGQDGQPTDLLIHEATMESHMLEDCRMKKHSTVSQAIDQGFKMAAKNTILTHFSQRYSKILPFTEIDGDEDKLKTVGVAFDHMIITPQTVDSIRSMYPALKVMFRSELDLLDGKKQRFSDKKVFNLGDENEELTDTDPEPAKRHKFLRALKDA